MNGFMAPGPFSNVNTMDILASQANSTLSIDTKATNISRFYAILIPSNVAYESFSVQWLTGSPSKQHLLGSNAGNSSANYPASSVSNLYSNQDAAQNVNTSNLWIVNSISNGIVNLHLPTSSVYATGKLIWGAD